MVPGPGSTSVLNIAGDCIAHGVRERASEIVTLELGRQTELEVSRSLAREVDADRFTRLDRMLIAEQESRDEFADLRPDSDTLETIRQNRALLIQRARKLERMGLANEVEAGRWTISGQAESVLLDLGERGDIIKTMHQALDREGLTEKRSISTYAIHRKELTERIVGRVLDKGLGGDELAERVRLVIDGVDGRVHHIEIDATHGEEVGRGMIVVAGSRPAGPRAADRNISNVARETGVYRPSVHLEQARASIDWSGGDPETFVRSHVRRLEALRRAGIVERIDADHWRIPANLSERGQAYDQARNGGTVRIGILSPTGLDQQVGHDGATWLDRELASRQRTVLAHEGFGLEVQTALAQRRQSLVQLVRHRPWRWAHPRYPRLHQASGERRYRTRRQGAGRPTRERVAAGRSRQLRHGRACRLDPAFQRPVRHDRRRLRLQPRSLATGSRTAHRPPYLRRRHARWWGGLVVRAKPRVGPISLAGWRPRQSPRRTIPAHHLCRLIATLILATHIH
jgi:hypothetical protein